ncbi:hypothetical protein PMI14_05277 [Acidovorax sp. CF316]|nr:hypothetical protein PMI14_05277 [Acidovorax sp. CF316]
MISAKSSRHHSNFVIDLNLNYKIARNVVLEKLVMFDCQALGAIAFKFVDLCERKARRPNNNFATHGGIQHGLAKLVILFLIYQAQPYT